MSLADIVHGVASAAKKGYDPNDVVDVISFIESSWGLGASLFPVQRVILKAHYGMALDDNPYGFDLSAPVPEDHPYYNPDLLDDRGFYKLRISISDFRRVKWEYFSEAAYLRKLYAEGRCNIEEVIPGKERREMVLSVGRRSGKCVLGDSLVLTDKGIFRIEDLGDPDGAEVQPLDVGVIQEGGVKSRSAFFYNGGLKNTRTLTTRCGYTLGGTDNHRIKILGESGTVSWKYVSDIQVGDTVCIHRTTDLWAPDLLDCTPYQNSEGYKDLDFPKLLDEDWGRLLGYLVGDGLWNYKGRVEVTVEHDETWDFLKDLFTRLFGSYSVVLDKRTENTGAIKFCSVGMRKFLHDLGFQMGTAKDAKMVPWSILQSPQSVVRSFLRGLFEADGGVESGGKIVSFCSASRRLAHEVQTLLLNLGIVSRVKPKKVKGGIYWILTVRGLRSRKTFADLVGFDSHKKMGPLLESLSGVEKEGGDAESIPHQETWAKRLLESVPKAEINTGWARSSLRQVLGNIIKPSSKDSLTYPRLKSVLEVAEDLNADSDVVAHFRDLQRLDYFYDPVVEIEEGFNPVFDLNVPEGESFVANGMTNHNTFLCACISAYETYKLIKKDNPHEYYRISPSNPIQIISVATDKDQAGLLYNDVSGHYKKCRFFGQYTANNTQQYARFQTPSDIRDSCRYTDDPRAAKVSLKVTFRSCVAKGLRGAGNITAILDELAHFTDNKSQSSAASVYNSISPSKSAFSPKNKYGEPIGDVEARLIAISSPDGREGFFYEHYRSGFAGEGSSGNMLCIQAPTWEVNPSVPASEFIERYAKNPAEFFTEYGAEFSDRTKGWLEKEEDLMACVQVQRRPAQKAPPLKPHFVGIDFGLVNDGTAVAIGHLEAINGQEYVVLDLLEQKRVGLAEHEHAERLDFEEIVDWIQDLSKRFYFVKGQFDQWAGPLIEQAVHKRGLTQIETAKLSSNEISSMWKNFKELMFEKRLILYNWPIPERKDKCEYLEELMTLQERRVSKNISEVQCPQVAGFHDDMSDALVRMVWLATQKMGSGKYTIAVSNGGGQAQHYNQYAARKKALQGGSHPSRMAPRMGRGGNGFRGR